MKIEGLVGKTLRARPAGLGPAMGTAARAGFLRPISGGWILLPLGVRIMERMCGRLLDGLDCQVLSVLTDCTEDSGRVLSELMQAETQSYRQLPLRIAVALHGGEAIRIPSAQASSSAWLAIAGAFADEQASAAFLARGASNVRRLAAAAAIDLGAANGLGEARALVAFNPSGHTTVLACAQCGSAYLREAAPFARQPVTHGSSGELERVHTPGASTIQALAEMLGIARERTLKALFLSTDAGELVFGVMRGDLDASIEKLEHALGTRSLRPANDAEITAAGASPGFASPIGLHVRQKGQPGGVRVIADPSVFTGHDFVGGANVEDYHFVHVDPERDFSVTEVADIAIAPAVAGCAACGAQLTVRTGTMVAHCLPLTAPSYSDESGSERRAAAGWMVTDVPALFEAVINECADDDGIAWPAVLSPADVHVVSLKADDAGREAVQILEQEGLSVLFDDRPIGAGAKFADADLIGCPLRVTISPRSLQAGGAELSGRKGASPVVTSVQALPGHARARLAALMST